MPQIEGRQAFREAIRKSAAHKTPLNENPPLGSRWRPIFHRPAFPRKGAVETGDVRQDII